MTRFTLSKFLLGLIALCLLPCLFMGSAGAQGTAPSGVSGNILWLHADSITGVASGAAVNSWTDTSPTAQVWANSATAGTYQSAGIGGKPAVTFYGSAYQPPSSASFNALATTGQTFVFVVKTSSTVFANTLFCKGVGGSKEMFFVTGVSGATGKFGRYSALEGNVVAADGAAHILSYTITAPSGGNTTEKIWQDGVFVGSLTGATPTFDSTGNATVGATSDVGFRFAGQMSEVAAYNTNITDANRQSIETYEGAKYGIAVTEPTIVSGSTFTLTNSSPSSLTLTATAATNGTAPYTYQWYRSAVSQSTPGAAIAGATSLTLTDTPPSNAMYFYRLAAIDSTSTTYYSTQTPGLLYAAPLSVGFIGDSITMGLYSNTATSPQVFQSWMQHYLGPRTVTVVNQGISGTTTANWQPGGTNYNAAIAAFGSSSVTPYVCIDLGANDANTNNAVPTATYKANILATVNALTTAGYKVILNQPTYVSPATAGNNEATDVLLAGYSAQLDSIVNGTTVFKGDRSAFNFFATHQSESGDGLHPNQTGYYDLGNLWAEAFARATGLIPTGGTKRKTQ